MAGIPTRAELEAARDRAIARRDALNAEVAEYRRERRKDALERLGAARERVKRAEKLSEDKARQLESGRELLNTVFSDKSPAERRRELEADIKELNSAHPELIFAEANRSFAWGAALALAAFFWAVFSNAAGILPPLWRNLLWTAAALAGAVLIIRSVSLLRLRKRRLKVREDFVKKYGDEDFGDIFEFIGKGEYFEREAAGLEAEKRDIDRELALAREELEKVEAEVCRDLDFSGEASGLTRELERAESELRCLREQLSRLDREF